MVLDTRCLYDFYEDGFYCGVKFTFIPDCTEEELKAWEKGFSDCINNRGKKSIEEFSKK